MNAFVAAGAGFLAAVLWFDLMFDVQVLGLPQGELPEGVLASIASYYARVTTAASAMSRLIASVMLATIAMVLAELATGEVRAWVAWVSLALVLAPVALAGARTLPSAVRLGARRDDPARQSALARSILRDHVICISAIAALLVLQLAFG
jgi:hypothetical protein